MEYRSGELFICSSLSLEKIKGEWMNIGLSLLDCTNNRICLGWMRFYSASSPVSFDVCFVLLFLSIPAFLRVFHCIQKKECYGEWSCRPVALKIDLYCICFACPNCLKCLQHCKTALDRHCNWPRLTKGAVFHARPLKTCCLDLKAAVVFPSITRIVFRRRYKIVLL